MIPHPPFASQLTLEEELARFERLKPRLRDVWQLLASDDDAPCTTVVVPSLTLDQRELAQLHGASFYEERLLFLLIRLRNPRAHVVYVTSQPVHPVILEYLLNLLLGIPASHARARLTMLCAFDGSPRPLTEKILERPRLIERIRCAIRNPAQAYLSVFNATPLERKLSVLLGIPLNGADPALAPLGSKSGSRKLFQEAGVACPAGYEDLRDDHDVLDALWSLRRERPQVRRAVIKLNEGFSGEGNATFRYPVAPDRMALERAFRRVSFVARGERRERFFAKFGEMGGIVEEFIEGAETRSPSAQLRTSPDGEVLPLSTHDQILDPETGQIFLGCRFPAADDYRQAVQEAGVAVGKALAAHGVVSRYGVDFMVRRAAPGAPWEVFAIEINLRLGGTTHPFLALRFLCGGALEPETGLYASTSGRHMYYRATDNLHASRYRGISPEDLLEIVTINQLNFSHRTETGVLFHMIGALSQYGKVGLTAIGNSHAEADAIYAHTLAVLEAETRYG
ncbi:MAG: ATP-grasp domain-containing protein [Gemmatimonadetes bacterium]|nr:ATP-grasp domain-containing protein [Gemmatimonadota bacterium]